jgi:hypothetical protein
VFRRGESTRLLHAALSVRELLVFSEMAVFTVPIGELISEEEKVARKTIFVSDLTGKEIDEKQADQALLNGFI